MTGPTPGCLTCVATGGACAWCLYWGADRFCRVCGKVTPSADVRGLWGCAACEAPHFGRSDEGPDPAELARSLSLTPAQVAALPADTARLFDAAGRVRDGR